MIGPNRPYEGSMELLRVRSNIGLRQKVFWRYLLKEIGGDVLMHGVKSVSSGTFALGSNRDPRGARAHALAVFSCAIRSGGSQAFRTRAARACAGGCPQD